MDEYILIVGSVITFALGFLCGKPRPESPIPKVKRAPKVNLPPENLNPIILDDRHEASVSALRDEED